MTDSTRDIIGRDDINDLDAILAVTNTDVDEVAARGPRRRRRDLHVGLRAQPSRAREALREGEDVAVERQRPARGTSTSTRRRSRTRTRTRTASASRWTSPARRSRSGATRSGSQFGIESQNWTLSQFMHGEQGALICTAQIVETVPWIDAKYYAATQVMDEARHVEVFAALPRHEALGALPDQRAPRRCCSTTSSPTAAGT